MQLPRSKRQKRDSATNLYRHCQLGGDCIPDVVNKVEQKTPADKILQIGGGLVYFGGLGIGTGKGTGGATGYRPLGGDIPATGRPSIPRPAIPIDPLGPVEVGGGAVTAEDSAIVPLLEESVTTVSSDPGPGIIVHEVEVHPPPGNPVVTTASGEGDESVAILEVGGPSELPHVTSTSEHSNPSFTTILHTTPTAGEASSSRSVVVAFDGQGSIVGDDSAFEHIPLDDFGPSEFDIEEPLQRTSTPLDTIVKRARQFYHRTVRQNPVSTPLFVTQPSALVEFENPAFDPDSTLTFDVDPDIPRAAPDSDFRDVKTLGKAHFGLAPGGRVRVSRLGTHATMRLRSGTHTGGKTHFFYDLSSISRVPESMQLELTPVGEQSGEGVIVLGSTDSAIIESTNFEGGLSYPDEALLDDYEEDFSHGQLAISTERGRARIVDVPVTYKNSVKAYITISDDLAHSVVVAHPDTGDTQAPVIPTSSQHPVTPFFSDLSSTFDLHPSLIKQRKRKRRPQLF